MFAINNAQIGSRGQPKREHKYRHTKPACPWGYIVPASLLVMAQFVGCGTPVLDTQYARADGRHGRSSLYGTAVLSEWFRQSGCRVVSLSKFSRTLERVDTVVWFPDDFEGPSPWQQTFIASWLSRGTGRTWVYVGRDYDAVAQYTEAVVAQVADVRRLWRFRAHALQEYERQRLAAKPARWPPLFSAERLDIPVRVTGLAGHPSWLSGVQREQVDIWLGERLHIHGKKSVTGTPTPDILSEETKRAGNQDRFVEFETGDVNTYDVNDRLFVAALGPAEVLLQSSEGPLVIRYPVGQTNQLIVIANGSFLFNAGLVNSEHRKLALALVKQCGAAKSVAFLTTNVTQRDYEPLTDAERPALQRWFSIWPLGIILAHLLLAGAAFIGVRFPLFGRPTAIIDHRPMDFGHHVAALGEFLRKSGDVSFAADRIERFYAAEKTQPLRAVVHGLEPPGMEKPPEAPNAEGTQERVLL